MKDTCFCDAIQFLKLRNKSTSIAILSACYSVGERYFHDNLNEIGFEIMKTSGDIFNIYEVIQKFKIQPPQK